MEQEIQFFKGRIFDGEKTMEEGWVELGADGKIVEIGEGKFPHSSPNVYGGPNFTILPGLVDAHMHFFGCRLEDIAEWNLIPPELVAIRSVPDMKNLLFSGFTAVRDLGSKAGVYLAQAESEGDILGPTVISSGHSLAQTGGDDDLKVLPLEMAQALSYSYYCDGPWECVSAVRKVIREGATVIKVYASGGFAAGGKPLPNLTVEELKAIVSEGHRANVKVTAHAYGEEALNNVIEAGVDSIEHGIGLTEDIAESIRKRGIYYVPTMSVYKAEKANPEYPGLLARIRGSSRVNRAEIIRRHLTKEIEIARDCDLKIAAGTDFVGAQSSKHGNNSIEMEYLSEFLGAKWALQAGTSGSVECVGLANMNSFKKNKPGEFIVVEGKPDLASSDIRKERIRFVIHDQKVFNVKKEMVGLP